MAAAGVVRFWCHREGTYALDDHGFLRDPDATWFGSQSANPGVVRTDELGDHRCLVLLGEPGAGKSTILSAPGLLVASEVTIVSIDLAGYGSEDRLVRDIVSDPSIVAWSAGTGGLCLVLDSLDEAQARIPHVGAVIADCIRRLPHDRLRLRVACRTADWPMGLEQALDEIFGAVAVVEILPLRRADASAISAAWCDPSQFLDEVVAAGAGPLAARPLTLRLLARGFGQSGALPERGAALYATGVRSLCGEQNPGRIDAGLRGVLGPDARVAVARRIAAASVFGGTSTLWTGPEVDADGDAIALARLVGGAEPAVTGSVEVTTSAVIETARTGLFAGRGGQQLGWAHATFADFLAADWVVANDLSVTQARALFLGPDGRCWPQTRLAATWAVAIAPDRFKFLTAADPEAFQGEVELPGDRLRAAVIDGLLSIAGSLTTTRWERSHRGLRHRDVADQIRPYLRDADVGRRRLAFELADECAAVDLRDDLAAIACDIGAEMQDRVSAGWALARLPDEARTAALRPLALEDAARGDDPADELKGVALLASWPQAISSEEVFSVLTPRRMRNYHGSYALFVDRFREGVGERDVDAGLEWLVRDLDGPAEDHVLGALANRVLGLAAARPGDPSVVDAFVQVVLGRVESYDHEGLMFEDFRHDERRDPLADPALRRAVATGVLVAEPTDKVVHRLVGEGPYSLGVVRSADLVWLINLYAEVDTEMRDAVRSLFQWTYNVDDPEHRDVVLGLSPEHPLYVDLVHAWVEAVALESPEAEEMRRSWDMYRRPRLVAPQSDDISERIEELLDRFDEGEAIGFWQSARLLTVSPGSKRYGTEFDPNVVGMPRWPTLTEELRTRLVDAAERYLRSYPCQPDEWLSKPDIRFHPAEAGYRAMILLLKVSPDRLRRLSVSAWVEWAPVLASWSTAAVNGATWEDKRELLELAGDQARAATRAALLTRVEAAVLAGQRPFASNEAAHLWDDNIAARYLRLAQSGGAEAREEIVSSLASHDFELVRPLLLEWLEDPSDRDRRRMAAGVLLQSDLERSWPALKPVLDGDLGQAEQVLGRVLTLRGDERLANARPAVMAEIYLWLRERFPPETDPQFDDAHIVGSREQIGRWRDALLRQLGEQGSLEAVDSMRAIVAALPFDRWLAHQLATAEAALRRNQWTPTPLPQLLQLARDRRAVLVHDPNALTAAVVEVLGEIQTRLTGGTPESHYLWDTHAGRPKSEDEISDYLANELNRALTARGVVINREVQVRRNRTSGIGERTDLLIDALPPARASMGHLSLPVEVKGAWNEDLCTAMREQLVDRYMHDVAASDGIYLVAWPDLASWRDTLDQRRRTLALLDRETVESQLAAQASALALEGARVHVVHLNVDYLRPS